MKKKDILFTIFIMFLFTIMVKVNAFTCELSGYVIEYDNSGKIISAKLKSSGEKVTKNLESYYHPTKSSECPTESNAQISFIDGRRTFYVAKKGEKFSEEAKKEAAEEEKKMNLGGCKGYNYEKSCKYNDYYSCIWNESEYGNYCNTDKLIYVQCGDSFDIPYQAPKIVSFGVNLLKIATPIILIIVGIITLLRALAASNEDEIKKAQKSLIRKIIAAVMVFFIIYIVQFVMLKAADSSEADDFSACLSCMINNECSKNVYYKTNMFGNWKCTYLSSKQEFNCKGD